MKAAILGSLLVLPGPAGAADISLSGNYTVTLTDVRPSALVGATACLSLQDDRGVDRWGHSGSWSFDGTPAGGFYVTGSVITLFTTGAPGAGGYLVMTGRLFDRGIVDTSITQIANGAAVLTGHFAMVAGC
jgi:hypothetical protein